MTNELSTRTELDFFHGYRSKHTPIFAGAGFGGAYRYKFRFPNNYGASLIVGGIMAYGGLELAVVRYDTADDGDFDLVYDTPITDDVVGYIETPAEVEDLLDRIKALPPKQPVISAPMPLALGPVVDPGDTQ